jgi:hypothetical protein
MEATTCRLCGADLSAVEEPRCPNCGLHRASEPGRSGYQRLAVGLAGVYLVTALLVLLTRGR